MTDDFQEHKAWLKSKGNPAFPFSFPDDANKNVEHFPGMTLRDWFAGQALANPALCTGQASDYHIKRWFGEQRTGIGADEIAAKQAGEYAVAMLTERSKTGEQS